jgi:hypothetical protein
MVILTGAYRYPGFLPTGGLVNYALHLTHHGIGSSFFFKLIDFYGLVVTPIDSSMMTWSRIGSFESGECRKEEPASSTTCRRNSKLERSRSSESHLIVITQINILVMVMF